MSACSIATLLLGAATVGYVAGSKRRFNRDYSAFCKAEAMAKAYEDSLKETKLDQSIAEIKLAINRDIEESQRIRMQILNDRLQELEDDIMVKGILFETLTKNGEELK